MRSDADLLQFRDKQERTAAMRAIIQRVLSASVVVKGETIASINKGVLVLVGICRSGKSGIHVPVFS